MNAFSGPLLKLHISSVETVKTSQKVDEKENCKSYTIMFKNSVTSKKMVKSDFCGYFHWKSCQPLHILSAYTFPWLK